MQFQSADDVSPEVTSWISRAKTALNRRDSATYQQLLGESVAIVMALLDELAASRSPELPTE